jgi:trimeric autotransporter adhesin
MSWSRIRLSLLLAVLSRFLCGCGGFNGVLPPTLVSLSPASVAAGSTDFVLTATGTNFISGTTILWNGASLSTTFSSATQLTAKVTAAQIAAPRNVSIRVMKPDSTTSGTLTLTVTGSSFKLSSISPPAVTAGSASFTLTATGVGFVSGAKITLNDAALATSFDAATQLHATVSASAVATAGTVTIGVTNPDKTTSNTLLLTVTPVPQGPVPTLVSIDPHTSPAGIVAPLDLIATGTNFVSGSQVMWNGIAVATTFVSATQLTTSIPPNFFTNANLGTVNVFVVNPDSTVSNELPFTITASPDTVPILTAVANPAGTNSSQVGDAPFTLTLTGRLFGPGAVACLSSPGQPTACAQDLPATFIDSTTATAQVPASVLAGVAEIPVMIRNAQSAPSAPLPYYVGISIYGDEAADVAWDPQQNLLYVSKPSTSSGNADTVMAFSPQQLSDAGAVWIYQFPANSNPDRLALSPDGQYLYVGLDGAGAVQQLVLGGVTPPSAGNTVSIGSDPASGPYYAMDLQISPLDFNTIAVARGIPLVSKAATIAQGGVAIYDGTIQRPNIVTPASLPVPPLLDTIQWSVDGSTIYAANNENASGNLYELAVSPNGVTLASDDDHPGLFTIPNPYIHLDLISGFIYGDDGLIVDPATANVQPYNFLVNGVMTPDVATDTAYFVAHTPADPNVLEYFVYQFDLNSTAPGPTLDLYTLQGIPQHVIRWNNFGDGTSGLAFTTQKFNCVYSPCNVGDGQLYVIDLPF